MVKYTDLSQTERESLYNELLSQYESFCQKGLSLDLSRGKPNASLIDFSNGLLSVDITEAAVNKTKGIDYRNYGMLDGVPAVKQLFAEALGLKKELNSLIDQVGHSGWNGK